MGRFVAIRMDIDLKVGCEEIGWVVGWVIEPKRQAKFGRYLNMPAIDLYVIHCHLLFLDIPEVSAGL